MPPRIPLLQCLRAQNVTSSPACRAFGTTPASQASTVAQKRRHQDPYAIAQAKARKAANLSRREVLKTERAAALGDPVRGIETSFVRSFDTALPPEPAAPNASTETRTRSSPSKTARAPPAKKVEHLNFFMDASELEQATAYSKWLSTSPHETEAYVNLVEDTTPEQRRQLLAEEQENAGVALQRIASLSLGSSADRQRANTQRCIDTFGRHNTDQTLPPRLHAADAQGNGPEKMERVGPDTGSSEVQIAILTAKIKTLADFLQSRGGMDKVNKRNLRLLVHKRQKHLQYLRRKERGGPRWQHVINTLGLTEGSWKGEISM